MMPWFVPSLRARREENRDAINGALPGADARAPNSVLRIMGDAIASQIHDLDGHLNWIVRQMLPDSAEGVYATRWANIWLRGGRNAASSASGAVTVTGAAGATVPAGTLFSASVRAADGTTSTVEFASGAEVVLAGASAVVEVTATGAGAAHNLDAAARLLVGEALPGIDAEAVVAAGGITAGADVEKDEAVRGRYLSVIRNPPKGGSASDWISWALEVPGVTRAWGGQKMGPGTYTVRIMLDEVRAGAKGIPTAADIARVRAHIDTVRPITVAEYYVLGPNLQQLDLMISGLSLSTMDVRRAVELELMSMLRARAEPGGTIYGSWISEAISSATGEVRHSGGFDDVPATSSGHLITLGTVTYG